MRVEEYVRTDGRSPYRIWFEALAASHAAKVAVALLRLEQRNTSNIKWFEGLGELRIDWGPGLRIYLVKAGDALIILLGGGSKSTQWRDVEQAKAMLLEYRARRRTLAGFDRKQRK